MRCIYYYYRRCLKCCLLFFGASFILFYFLLPYGEWSFSVFSGALLISANSCFVFFRSCCAFSNRPHIPRSQSVSTKLVSLWSGRLFISQTRSWTEQTALHHAICLLSPSPCIYRNALFRLFSVLPSSAEFELQREGRDGVASYSLNSATVTL